MVLSKNFAAGLLTGAVVGGVVAAFMDPLKDKSSQKLKKRVGEVVHSMGEMMEDMKK